MAEITYIALYKCPQKLNESFSLHSINMCFIFSVHSINAITVHLDLYCFFNRMPKLSYRNFKYCTISYHAQEFRLDKYLPFEEIISCQQKTFNFVFLLWNQKIGASRLCFPLFDLIFHFCLRKLSQQKSWQAGSPRSQSSYRFILLTLFCSLSRF